MRGAASASIGSASAAPLPGTCGACAEAFCFRSLLCLEVGTSISLGTSAAVAAVSSPSAGGSGARLGASAFCWVEVPVLHCLAETVLPVWSFALWFPLHTFVGLMRMLHLCEPAGQLPALFLQLFLMLK